MRPAEFFRAVLASWGCAGRGLAFAVRSQRNFRLHLAAAGAALAAGVGLRFSRMELALLTATVGVVLFAELFNTALESALNLVERRNHPVVAVAKDVAAGAVLVMCFVAAIVGLLLFGPRLWALCGWGVSG